MQLISVAYAFLALNSLPLLGMLLAAIGSAGFSHTESWTISFAYTLSTGVAQYLKVLLGTVVVPLVTAYAVGKLDPNTKIPKEAARLFILLGVLLLLGIILGSLYPTFLQRGLAHANALETTEQQGKFEQVPWDYAKESLTYICLLLGIRLPKG